ncbi:carbonic anhydrase [Geoglobus acetivorans]|uniref:Carbonic anhydrase n=1 Tax=Geoglobus acetivorans TaxID=565033 RepID=A0ABZ3H373_GEOAI|nr:hypothetical protein [Geoglobus acetivorans]
MKFGCAVNCIDGRAQIPVIEWMKENFEVDFADMITEPGIVKLFEDEKSLKKLIEKIKISVEKHGSSSIAVVAHHDCAGNPVEKGRQIEQLKTAVEKLRKHFENARIAGLWVNEKLEVEVVFQSRPP